MKNEIKKELTWFESMIRKDVDRFDVKTDELLSRMEILNSFHAKSLFESQDKYYYNEADPNTLPPDLFKWYPNYKKPS